MEGNHGIYFYSLLGTFVTLLALLTPQAARIIFGFSDRASIVSVFSRPFAEVSPKPISLDASAKSRFSSVLSRMRRPILSAWVRSHLHLTMETHPWATGGPEGCAQMIDTLRVLGVSPSSLTLTEDVTAVFDKYTHGLSVWQGPDALTPGSVTVTTEWAPCTLPHRRGIKQLGYELSIQLGKEQLVDPQKLHCLWFGHSHYTRQFVDGPSRAIMRQYFSEVYTRDTPTSLAQATTLKRNLVIIDGDFDHELGGGACCVPPPGGHAQDLHNSLVSAGIKDVEVVVLKGLTSVQVRELFKQAKVIVDGHMTGMERANQEASLSWVVPVPELWSNGASKVDYPLPSALLGFTSTEEMHAKVASVLSNYSMAAMAASPTRILNLAQKKINRDDAARLFESVGLAVHVAVCGGVKSEEGVSSDTRLRSAILVAAAVHLSAPLSSVVLHVGAEEGPGGACSANTTLAAVCARVSAGGGLFQHATIVFSSPLCSAAAAAAEGGGKEAGSTQVSAAAYAEAPFGPSEHIALLSWRALPLEAAALSSWQDSTRSSPSQKEGGDSGEEEDGGGGGIVTCRVSQLLVKSLGGGAAVPLGALLDGEEKNNSTARVAVDVVEGGVNAPTHACSFLSSSSTTSDEEDTTATQRHHGPVFLDLLAAGVLSSDSARPPMDAGCELMGDEAVLDVYAALTGGEGMWDTIALDMAPYLQTCILGGEPRPVTQHLCSSQRFKALAKELGLQSLCT